MKDYKPYTEAEYVEVKTTIDAINQHIPNDKMGWIWGNHNRILGTNEPQPCSCGSAAANWIRAVGTIRNFVSQIESQP